MTAELSAEEKKVLDWRLEVLLETGVSQKVAEKAAKNSRVDLHVVRGHVARGCKPNLAVKLATPVESDLKR